MLFLSTSFQQGLTQEVSVTFKVRAPVKQCVSGCGVTLPAMIAQPVTKLGTPGAGTVIAELPWQLRTVSFHF